MTDKDRVEEVEKDMDTIVAEILRDVSGVDAYRHYTDKLLSLKDKDGKPMLAILSEDQSLPKGLTARLNKPELSYYVYDEIALSASNFRRVIIEEE